MSQGIRFGKTKMKFLQVSVGVSSFYSRFNGGGVQSHTLSAYPPLPTSDWFHPPVPRQNSVHAEVSSSQEHLCIQKSAHDME